MIEPSERMPGSGGEQHAAWSPAAEPAVALTLLTDRQRRLANLIANNPSEAWIEIGKRFIPGGERPALERYGLSNIGGTVVAINKGENKLLELSLNIDDDNLAHFREICGGDGLSKVFIEALEKGISGNSVLLIEARLIDSRLTLNAINYMGYVSGEWEEVSPKVFAVLFDMLEPQGIEGSARNEGDQQEESGPFKVVVEEFLPPAEGNSRRYRGEPSDRITRALYEMGRWKGRHPLSNEPSLGISQPSGGKKAEKKARWREGGVVNTRNTRNKRKK